jgi:hypothetical protein
MRELSIGPKDNPSFVDAIHKERCWMLSPLPQGAIGKPAADRLGERAKHFRTASDVGRFALYGLFGFLDPF